jgi:molybdopterin synthase catalytic subunit
MVDEAFARFDIRAARHPSRGSVAGVRSWRCWWPVPTAGQAFQACEFLMDYLKTQAPFWKKEHTPDGARWVDARVADDGRWRWGIVGGTP